MMPGSASGVCLAALWNRTMEPGQTLEVTRLVMSAADRSFQSRLSTLAAVGKRWETKGCECGDGWFFLSDEVADIYWYQIVSVDMEKDRRI